MAVEKNIITRRDFVTTTAQASMAIALGLPLRLGPKTAEKTKSRVVLIRHADAVDADRKINAKIIADMLNEAVAVLQQQSEPLAAWRQLITATDIVGVKTNHWGPLPTPQELEQAIVEKLRQVGVAEKNISVRDQGIHLDEIFQHTTALINIRPMRTHHWAGVGGCLKNYILFSNSPSQHHPDTCASLGAVWQLPNLRQKTRVNILVLLTPLFHGIGPHHFDLKYTWAYRGLLVGNDPVAVDAVGLRIIEAHRLEYFGKRQPLWPPAKHIGLADTVYQVGNADLNNIELIKRGWAEGALI